jgi:regulator of telomere elongation helicase 1
MQSHANSTTIWERICKHKKPVVEPRQSSLFLSSIEVNDMTYKESAFCILFYFYYIRIVLPSHVPSDFFLAGLYG